MSNHKIFRDNSSKGHCAWLVDLFLDLFRKPVQLGERRISQRAELIDSVTRYFPPLVVNFSDLGRVATVHPHAWMGGTNSRHYL